MKISLKIFGRGQVAKGTFTHGSQLSLRYLSFQSTLLDQPSNVKTNLDIWNERGREGEEPVACESLSGSINVNSDLSPKLRVTALALTVHWEGLFPLLTNLL